MYNVNTLQIQTDIRAKTLNYSKIQKKNSKNILYLVIVNNT